MANVKRSKEEKRLERLAARARRSCVLAEAMAAVSSGRRLYVEVSRKGGRVSLTVAGPYSCGGAV
jgi:hypothetical protein